MTNSDAENLRYVLAPLMPGKLYRVVALTNLSLYEESGISEWYEERFREIGMLSTPGQMFLILSVREKKDLLSKSLTLMFYDVLLDDGRRLVLSGAAVFCFGIEEVTFEETPLILGTEY